MNRQQTNRGVKFFFYGGWMDGWMRGMLAYNNSLVKVKVSIVF